MHETHIVNEHQSTLGSPVELDGRGDHMDRTLAEVNDFRRSSREARQLLARELVGIGHSLIQEMVLEVAESQGIESFILDDLMEIGKNLRPGSRGYQLSQLRLHRARHQSRAALQIPGKPFQRQGVDQRHDRIGHEP
jgi:hypothetical protein